MSQKEQKENINKEILQTELTEAFQNYQKNLNAHAYFKLNNRTIGEDLVQETFLKTWNYLASGGKILLMKAFLYHILNNLIIDEYRKRKSSSLDLLLEKGFEPYSDNTKKVFDVMDGERIITLVEELPNPYRQVIYMKYVLELSIEEMSSITGKSKNTIAVQSHRGLEKLKIIYFNK